MHLNNKWKINTDTGKWSSSKDRLVKSNYDALREDLQKLRFYQKCLSGSTYVGVSSTASQDKRNANISDIYDILNFSQLRSFYYDGINIPYIQSFTPPLPDDPVLISTTQSMNDILTKDISEYNYTLKNLFTPERLINDQKRNLFYVDLATTEQIDDISIKFESLEIDNTIVRDGHRILIKDQFELVTIPTATDPNTFFFGDFQVEEVIGTNTTYRVPSTENGIYFFLKNRLVRSDELDDYEKASKYSIAVKLGSTNRELQFKLKRLTSGQFPLYNSDQPTWTGSSQLGDSMNFIETHNWVIRNRMDYNNLYELVLNDTLKHGTQSFQVKVSSQTQSAYVTYSIPERTLAVGEFGVIFNHQEGITNIIDSKYKVTLRSIDHTNRYYWVCGDQGVLLRIDKADHSIKRIRLQFENFDPKLSSQRQVITQLNSISFYNELRGGVVGKFNQIWITSDGGKNWKQIYLADFDGYNFNTISFSSIDRFYVGGDNGVFIEFEFRLGNWLAHKRRISRYVNGLDDEFELVDDINAIEFFTSNQNQYVAIGSEMNNIFLYDVDNSLGLTQSFIYLQDPNGNSFGDISAITYVDNQGLYFSNFESIITLDPFQYQVVATNSNIVTTTFSSFLTQSGINSLFNYQNEIVLAGNVSTWEFATQSFTSSTVFDTDYFNRLRPRLLFMDYDIGSKLYWFDDFGQYRIPDTIEVPISYLLDSSGSHTQIGMNPNTETIFDQNTLTTTTYTETNWITYWKDRQKTFEYYTSLDESNVVEPSFTFSSSDTIGVTFSYTTASITTDYNDILPLMPSATPPNQAPNIDQQSRFREIVGTPITTPTNIFDLYFYDYLGIWRTQVPSGDIPPQKGDVLHISNDVFEGKFVINKVIATACATFSSQATVTFTPESSKLGTQEIRVYPSISLTNGPITTLPYSTQNQWTQLLHDAINANTVSGLGHGFSATIDSSQPNWVMTISGPFSYVGQYLIYERIYVTSKGSKYIFTGTQSQLCDYYSYFYTDFPQNILNNIPNATQTTIVRDLNKYPRGITQSNIDYFIENFTQHYAGLSYDCEQVVDQYPPLLSTTQSFKIEGKYSQWSAYYNLQSKVDVIDYNATTYSEEIKYPTGFLNFGYTPTYNLLSYLNFLDPSEYLPTKEFNIMPNYIGVPGPNSVQPLDNQIFIDVGLETNKLKIGSNLKHIYDSLFKWTFVDINVDGPLNSNVLTERLLIIEKYYDTANDWYVVEFHDKINFTTTPGDIDTIDIISRRTLQQISDDLQYINRMHRPEWLSQESYDKTLSFPAGSWLNYETEIDFKVPTDSYCKILLSDSSLMKDITGILYTDYKYELAIQLVNLIKEYDLSVSHVTTNSGFYQFNFTEPHRIDNYDQVLIGLDGISTDYPTELLGVHHVEIVSPYSIKLPIPQSGLFPTQNFTVFHTKDDDFLNFQPVDLFDIGIGDKLVKQAIEIPIENYDIVGSRYDLLNIDLNKYKFRLIDGLDIVSLVDRFPWILEAEIADAVIGLSPNGDLTWYKGIWFCGRWFGGRWISGRWVSGDWYSGVWSSKFINDKYTKVEVDEKRTDLYNSIWYGGRFFDGTWENGTWYTGRWYNGTFKNGRWFEGTFNDGIWENGEFKSGIWVLGTFKAGIFNQTNGPSYWLSGKFTGGDFENGTWYNGVFDQKNNKISRFGTKSSNSRPSIWRSGKFLDGQFHSRLYLNDGVPDVSLTHKYSQFRTGLFAGGDFYGGIAHNINFKNTTWHGGISEDIDVVSISAYDKTVTLSGEYDFNAGDVFYLLDSENIATIDPVKVKALVSTYDESNDETIVNISRPYLTIPEGVWQVTSIDHNLLTYPVVVNYATYSNSNVIEEFIDSQFIIYDNQASVTQTNLPAPIVNAFPINATASYTTQSFVCDLGIGYDIYDIIDNQDGTITLASNPFGPLSVLNFNLSPVTTNLKCVSFFENSKWDSGVWFNGVFKDGTFNGGVWYDGLFEGNWG